MKNGGNAQSDNLTGPHFKQMRICCSNSRSHPESINFYWEMPLFHSDSVDDDRGKLLSRKCNGGCFLIRQRKQQRGK